MKTRGVMSTHGLATAITYFLISFAVDAEVPTNLADGWQTAAPQRVGLAPARLDALSAAIEGAS